MIQLVIWTILCVVAALSLQRRPVLLLAAVLVIRLLIPSPAGSVLTGTWQGSTAMHPATILMLASTPFLLVTHAKSVARELRRWPFLYAALGLVITLSLTIVITLTGPKAILGLTNSLLASILYFLIVRVVAQSQPSVLRTLLRCFLVTASAIAVLVLVQWATKSLAPWAWAVQNLNGRPVGTFDSPLDLGFVLAIAIPLLVGVKKSLYRYAAMILLVLATVLSESRTPALLACLGVVFVVIVTTRSIAAVLIMAVAGAGAYFVATSLPVLAGLLDRFTGDDGNSAAQRDLATNYILTHIQSVLFLGNGWGTSYTLKGTLLRTSLENGYAILAFDIGGIVVVLLLLVQLRVVLTRGRIPGSWLAGIFFIAAGFSYSGIVNMSAISLVGWFALSLCMQGVDERRADHMAAREENRPQAVRRSGWNAQMDKLIPFEHRADV